MTTRTETLNGAGVITRLLEAQGIRTVFSLAGAAHFRLLDSLDRAGFAIVSGRHESATVAEADGYSRVTGKPGIALVIANQGFSNAIGGLATAYEACSPVVVLVARPPVSQDEPELLEDVDELALARPITKWARTVHDVERLEEYVEVALRRAQSGRPGPCVLAIPSDLLSASVAGAAPRPVPLTRCEPTGASAEAIERAVDLLVAAERPLVLAGGGATRAGAGPALRRLAERYGIPVLGNALGRGLVPEDLVIGFPWPLAQVASAEADVVVAVGTRLGQRFAYGKPPRWRADARFIQVNTDPDELGRNRYLDVAIAADAATTVGQLCDALERRHRAAGDPTWVNRAMAARLARIDEVGRGDAGPIHPYRVARELAELLPADTIVVQDGADVANWFSAIIRIRQAPGYMDHQPLGSMGIGTPLAVGAAAGAAEIARLTGQTARRVVHVTGDGSFGFYPSEYNGAALARLPIVTIISNDGGWGTERHGQLKSIGRTVNTDLGHARYELIAQAYGCYGESIDEPSQIAGALRRAFDVRDRPAVLNVVTDPNAGRLRKEDPRLQMIAHDDIIAARRSHYTPPVA